MSKRAQLNMKLQVMMEKYSIPKQPVSKRGIVGERINATTIVRRKNSVGKRNK